MRLKRVDKIKIVKHITWNRRKKLMNSLIVKAKRTFARIKSATEGFFNDIASGYITKKEKKVVLLFIFIVLLLSIALPVGAAHWVLKLN